MTAYPRRMHHASRIAAVLAALALTACPKPQPEPVPADCSKPGQACADQPHTEGPPPVGSTSPPSS